MSEPILTRNDATHTYYLTDESGVAVELPSVTRVISPATSLFYRDVNEAVMRKAAERGTDVHAAIDLDNEGALDEDSITDEVRPYLDSYREFREHKKPRIILASEMVWHRTLMYAGELDTVMSIDSVGYLVDYKTSAITAPAHGLQTAAYYAALRSDPKWKETPPLLRASLILNRDGTYSWFEHESSTVTDFALFCSYLNVYRWEKKHGK